METAEKATLPLSSSNGRMRTPAIGRNTSMNGMDAWNQRIKGNELILRYLSHLSLPQLLLKRLNDSKRFHRVPGSSSNLPDAEDRGEHACSNDCHKGQAHVDRGIVVDHGSIVIDLIDGGDVSHL